MYDDVWIMCRIVLMLEPNKHPLVTYMCDCDMCPVPKHRACDMMAPRGGPDRASEDSHVPFPSPGDFFHLLPYFFLNFNIQFIERYRRFAQTCLKRP